MFFMNLKQLEVLVLSDSFFPVGSGDPCERLEAGPEAGYLRAAALRRVPLLFRHDRVQRLHLRQPAHVSGGLLDIRASSQSCQPRLVSQPHLRCSQTPHHRTHPPSQPPEHLQASTGCEASWCPHALIRSETPMRPVFIFPVLTHTHSHSFTVNLFFYLFFFYPSSLIILISHRLVLFHVQTVR